MKKCFNCQKEGNYKSFEVQGMKVPLCFSCRTRLKVCDKCKAPSVGANSIAISIDEVEQWCEDCRDNNAFCCDNCDKYFGNDNFYPCTLANGLTYCEDCRDNNTFDCYNCEEIFNNDYAYSCDNCDNSFCESCFSDHYDSEEDSNNLPEPSHSVNYQFCRTSKKGKYLTSKRFVGVELEAENGNADNIEWGIMRGKGITACSDGSLDESGIEIQTPPSQLKKAEDIINFACKTLIDNGFEATASCGLHIHLDARELKKHPTKLIRVFKMYYVTEDILFAMLPASRSNNHYCQTLSEGYTYSSFKNKKLFKQTEAMSFWYKRPIKNVKEMPLGQDRYNSTRYSGLNFHSVYYRGSIEIRYHSGTLNPIKILNWIILNQALIDYAEYRFDEKELDILTKFTDLSEKIDYLATILKLKPELVEYIKARIGKFNNKVPVTFYKRYGWEDNYKKRVAELEEQVIEGKLTSEKAKKLYAKIKNHPTFRQKPIAELIGNIDINKIASEFSEN